MGDRPGKVFLEEGYLVEASLMRTCQAAVGVGWRVQPSKQKKQDAQRDENEARGGLWPFRLNQGPKPSLRSNTPEWAEGTGLANK